MKTSSKALKRDHAWIWGHGMTTGPPGGWAGISGFLQRLLDDVSEDAEIGTEGISGLGRVAHPSRRSVDKREKWRGSCSANFLLQKRAFLICTPESHTVERGSWGRSPTSRELGEFVQQKCLSQKHATTYGVLCREQVSVATIVRSRMTKIGNLSGPNHGVELHLCSKSLDMISNRLS